MLAVEQLLKRQRYKTTYLLLNQATVTVYNVILSVILLLKYSHFYINAMPHLHAHKSIGRFKKLLEQDMTPMIS